jgi:hypothetical protein
MLLKGQGKSPAVLPTRKTRDSLSTEGLVGPIPNLFILIDGCILNELKSTLYEKRNQLDFYTRNCCYPVYLSSINF